MQPLSASATVDWMATAKLAVSDKRGKTRRGKRGKNALKKSEFFHLRCWEAETYKQNKQEIL